VETVRLIKELKVQRIFLYPRLFSTLPATVAERFESDWAPVERLAALLSRFPDAALRFLLLSPTGAFVISPEERHYVRGPQTLPMRVVENVGYVSAESLLGDGVAPLHVAAHLYDHLLGSGGAPEGPNLSDGAGISPAWNLVAKDVQRLFALGHNPDPICQRDPGEYFAQSLALYAIRPIELNVADPLMHKLLKRTFFSNTFWEES
jgi:hypothetical protein